MGLSHSPKVVTDSLVFYYDENNIKSYRGPVMQNFAASIGYNNTTGTGISIVGGYETVEVPQIGQSNVTFSIIQNNYTSFSPNSSDCCPSPFFYGTGIVVSPSTQYTYAIVYKNNSGYTHPNFMYRYEYTSNGGTYVTEAGVHNASNRVHLGDGWYWAWATFTTQATTNWLGYHGAFYYRYSNASDKMSVARVLIAQGDYTSLHPRFWPLVNTTRSASDSVRDLLNSSTVSATALTYASNGAISYNGSSNYIRWNNNTALDTQTPTVEVWVKTNSLNQNGFFFEKGAVNTQYALFQEGTAIQWRTYNNPSSYTTLSAASSYLSTSNWAHVVATYVSGSKKIYVNGVEVASDTSSGTLATNSGMTIGEYNGGAYRYNGSIAVVKVYNKALTAAEVIQNFNALRGRFGV